MRRLLTGRGAAAMLAALATLLLAGSAYALAGGGSSVKVCRGGGQLVAHSSELP